MNTPTVVVHIVELVIWFGIGFFMGRVAELKKSTKQLEKIHHQFRRVLDRWGVSNLCQRCQVREIIDDIEPSRN